MILHKKGKRPPSPDLENYTWIDTKEGGYWRRKRGTIKPAKVNAAYKQGIAYMKMSAPAASRIMKKVKTALCMKLKKHIQLIAGLVLFCLNNRGSRC